MKFVRLNICSANKQKTIRLKFPKRHKNKRCYRKECLQLGAVVKFEHIITCVKSRREPNSSANFVCTAIEIACTLKSDSFLPQNKHNQINRATLVENKYVQIYKIPVFRRYFLQYWMFVCLGRNSNPAMPMVFLKNWKLILHRLISWAIAYAVSNIVATIAYLSS